MVTDDSSDKHGYAQDQFNLPSDFSKWSVKSLRDEYFYRTMQIIKLYMCVFHIKINAHKETFL